MDSRIEEIMYNFDFEKVYKVMKFLDWEYRGEPVTIAMIVVTALELLNSAWYDTKDETYRSTGGFTATKRDGTLTLAFHIDHWSA